MNDMGAALLNLVRSASCQRRTEHVLVDWRDEAKQFGLRLRLVRLRKRRWWTLDNGPLLAFRRGSGDAVVLIFAGREGYRLFDPVHGGESVCDEDMATRLEEEAFMPYQTGVPLLCRVSPFDLRAHLDALRQSGYGLLAAGIACGVMLTPLLLHRLLAKPLSARYSTAALMWVALAAAFVTAESYGALAGLRSRLKQNLLLHATIWNRVLQLPLKWFRAAPAANPAKGLAAGEEASAQRSALRSEVAKLLAAVAVIVAVLPVSAAIGCFLLLILGAAEYAATIAYPSSLYREAARAPKISRTRLLLAWYLPVLRSLGAMDWSLRAGRSAAEEEAIGKLRTGLLRQRAEMVGRWGPVFVALAIMAAMANEGGRNISVGLWCVAVVSSLWAGSAACTVASAFAAIKVANAHLKEVDALLEPPAAAPAPRGWNIDGIHSVSFGGVGFAYPHALNPTLAGVHFELRRGECVAITGPSGSGKTTLIRLLTGLDDPTCGVVRVNGTDLRSADVRDYRRRIGAVFQDEALEVATARRLIVGMAPIPEERAWEAARLARIAETIANLPMGMQTMIAPMTVPSALLHQLSIARALARQPEMLVLDEALSNLDSDVQSGLVSDLRRLGITVVICTHRPSTMALADRCLRLEGGRIAI